MALNVKKRRKLTEEEKKAREEKYPEMKKIFKERENEKNATSKSQGRLLEKEGKTFNVPASELENVTQNLEKQQAREARFEQAFQLSKEQQQENIKERFSKVATGIDQQVANQPIPNVEVQTTPAEQKGIGGIPGAISEAQRISGVGIAQSPEEFKYQFGTSVLKAGILGATLAPFALGSAATTFTSAKEAVQAGVAAKNALTLAEKGKLIFEFGVGLYGLVKSAEGVANYLGRTQVIEEQQQAVNTLGQMASTIEGQATSGAGDWRKGLAELDYIEKQILFLESSIKAGTIASATIKVNGKIYDIEADMADQLATIEESRTKIRSFVLTNSFPEMSDLDIQTNLRQLEDEGIIQPSSFQGARRPAEEAR